MNKRVTPRTIVWASALATLATLSTSALAQAPKASYVPEGSFQLPKKGEPGGAERPTAVAVAPDGEVHVADERGQIYVYGESGSYVRSYGETRLRRPVAVAITAAGAAFVLDADRRQVLVFDASGLYLRAWGEKGSRGGQLSDPIDLALGPAGFVHVLDRDRRGIQIFSQDGTFVRDIFVGDIVREPSALAVGTNGAIYVADANSTGHIYAFAPFSELPWVGAPPRAASGLVVFRGAQLAEVAATAVNDRGSVVVLDRRAGRVWRRNLQALDENGPDDALYGGAGTGRGSFREAVDVAFSDSRDLLILDSKLRKVERIRLRTDEALPRLAKLDYPIRVTRGEGELPAPLLAVGHTAEGSPRLLMEFEQRVVTLMGTTAQTRETVYGDSVVALTPDPADFQLEFYQGLGDVAAAVLADSIVVVADSRRNRFAIYNVQTAQLIGSYGDNYQDARRLRGPRGLAVLPDGRIVVSDTGNDLVKVFSPDLASLVASYPFSEPAGVAVAPDGAILVWSRDGTRVGRLNEAEERFDPPPAGLLPANVAWLTFDQAGNLFALDGVTHRVTVVEAGLTRVLIQLGAEGALKRPTRVSVDRLGHIYITDDGARRTLIYRWDVHLPALARLDLALEVDAATLRWPPGPERFVQGYEIQGAAEANGPFQALAVTAGPPYRLAAQTLAAVPPRFVRVAPLFITGVRGRATPSQSLAYFASAAAYERGEFEAARRAAEQGVREVEAGAVGASDQVRGALFRLGFASSYRLDELEVAVDWARRAAEIPMPRPELIEFLFMLSDSYLRLGDPRAASQQILTLVGQGPRPEYYLQPAVVKRSFEIYRQLRDGGYQEDGLEFMRLYAQSMPSTVPEALRNEYVDSITVYATRSKLGAGIAHWRNADYLRVVDFFERLLTQGGLSVEQRVVSWQILAAAYYAFGRRGQAEDTFRQVLDARPGFDLISEITRLQRLYDLSIYNPETRRYFSGLSRRY